MLYIYWCICTHYKYIYIYTQFMYICTYMYIFVDEPLAITGMHIEARPHRHIPSTQIHGQIH